MASSIAHRPGTLEDAELARRATAGDGHAFAELYDRHERRVYGFCMRMLATPHDAADATQETFVRMLARLPALQGRELNFVAYTLATARNVCYDAIAARRTVEPLAEQPQPRAGAGASAGEQRVGADEQSVGMDIDMDPERFALLSVAREDVRAANAALPARQREVLALREIELLSYDEIGELMGLNRNAVAQLISRARIKLAELLRGSALASVSTSSPDCERALPLLAALQDKQGALQTELGKPAGMPAGLDWLQVHLASCDTCRLSRAAMEEAGTSYRALALLVPAAWLRRATIARAAEFVGADWSHVGPRVGPEGVPPDGLSVDVSRRPLAWGRRRGLLAAALAVLGLCLLLVLVLAGDVGRDAGNSLSPAATTIPAVPVALGAPPQPHRRAARADPARTPLSVTAPPNSFAAGVVGAATSPVPRHLDTNVPARERQRHGHRSPPARRVPAKKPPSPVTAPPSTPPPAPTPTTTTAPSAQSTPAPAPTPGGSTTSTTTEPPPGAVPGGSGSTGTTPTESPPGLIP